MTLEKAVEKLSSLYRIDETDIMYACSVQDGIYFACYNSMQPIFISDDLCTGLNGNKKEHAKIIAEAEKKISNGDVF